MIALTLCALVVSSCTTYGLRNEPGSSGKALAALIEEARADAAKKPAVGEALMRQKTVYVIPAPANSDHQVNGLLPFPMPEYEYIPVFSDEATFDIEAAGTGFEGQAVPMATKTFASTVPAGMAVILNPGHRPALEFTAAQLKQWVRSE